MRKNPSTVDIIYNIDLLNFIKVYRFNSFIVHRNANYLKDILDGNMLFKSFNSMQGQCNINFRQYYSLVNSIPRIYISKLKEANNTNSLGQYKTFDNSFLEKV